MRIVVVEASVLLAGLFKDGVVRDLLLNSDEMNFVAPAYIQDEAERHLHEVAQRAKLPDATVRAVLEDILGSVTLVPREVYSGKLAEAQAAARNAGAVSDADYVALSLTLRAPIWTDDLDFRRIHRVKNLTTRQLSSLPS